MEISLLAGHVLNVATSAAETNRTCYPNWRAVEKEAGLDRATFDAAFEELCELGQVFHAFPSFLTSMFEEFPLPPMFGPVTYGERGRPIGLTWAKIRKAIFLRDDYTCRYCGARGVRLECDHVIPVSRGGGHTDDNLVTSCRPCNRSKRNKLVAEWKRAA